MDQLQNYLRITRDQGKQPSEAGFNAFRAGPPRETDQLAHHHRYLDAHGNPFGVANHDTEADLLRRKQVAEANRRNAQPVPASYALSEDTPEKRMAEAAHTAQITAAIARDQRES